MLLSITYNLPDELELYVEALKAKTTNVKSQDERIKEMHDIISLYMLQPNHDNLMALNMVLEKYK